MDALQGAMLAQAQRFPQGNVGDALRWFDDPHRPGVSDALVAAERAPGRAAGQRQQPQPQPELQQQQQQQPRQNQAWGGGRAENHGFVARPTPPAARRFEHQQQRGPSGMTVDPEERQWGGGGAGRPAGYRPGQRLTPNAARNLEAAPPRNHAGGGGGGGGGGGAAEHPNLDLRSFRDYLLQPKSFSAREPQQQQGGGAMQLLDRQQAPAVSFGEQATSAEVMSNLGQLYARLTAVENSEQALQRTVQQQDQEIRAARYEAKDNAKQTQLVAQLEERLRHTEASESASSMRLRQIEESINQGNANTRERQQQLDNELRDMQRLLAAAEQKLGDAAIQRRELHGDVEGVHDKLADRVEKYATALNEQIQRSNEERLKLESSTKGLLHEVSTAVTDKMRNMENLLLPELGRKTTEAVNNVNRKMEDGLSKIATALREVDQLRNAGDAQVRQEVGSVQELVQKGLLQLKAEAEKQKSTVATLVKAEIQNRMLNMDGIGSKMEEMRLDVANEHQEGLQQLAEVRAGLLEQLQTVSAEAGAARRDAAQARELMESEMGNLRSEFEASDHGMMLEWRGMMGAI